MNTVEKYAVIKLDLIDLPETLIRDENDPDHISELSLSMSKHGLLEPIVVREEEPGRFRVVAGVHRTLAARHLGWQGIPAMIRPEGETTSDHAMATIENVMRKQMTLPEECAAVKFLAEQENKSTPEICAIMGKSRQWVDRRLAAPNLPEKVRAALFENLITAAAAEEIAKVEHEGMRNSLLAETIYQRRTLSEIRDLAKIYQETPTFSEAVAAGVEAAKNTTKQSSRIYQCALCGSEGPIQDVRAILVCATGCRTEEKHETTT